MARPQAIDDVLMSMGQLLASVLLLISALWLPWATYRTHNVDLTFGSGWLDLVVVVCGVVAFVVASVSLTWKHVAGQWCLCAAGCVALISSLALALSAIGAANLRSDTVAGAGLTQTSYGTGSILGVAASVLLLALSIVHVSSRWYRSTSETAGGVYVTR